MAARPTDDRSGDIGDVGDGDDHDRNHDHDHDHDLAAALSQNNVEEKDLAAKDDASQFLQVPQPTRRAGDAASEDGSRLEKVESALSHVTDTSFVTQTNTRTTSADQTPEKASWRYRYNPLRRNPPPVPEERAVCREYNAGFLSLLTFQWMNPLMTTGYKRPVELNDIWLVNPDRSSATMMARLMASFRRRTARGERNPLVWALFDTFRGEFLLGGACALCSALFQVFSPFTTRYLIQFATDAYIAQKTGQPGPNLGRGIGLAVGITFMQMCQSLGTNHFLYRGMVVGGESRAVLINAIFEKSLVISGRAKAGGKALRDEATSNGIDDAASADKPADRGGFLARTISRTLHPKGGPNVTPDKGTGIAGDGTGWNNGKIVNLMSVDTYRVDQASGMFHIIWTAPVQVVVVLVVLCINLGYSALAGYALLLIVLPLLTKAIKSLFARRKKINKVTDQRVTLTQEILGSVRFVKFFGWETSFLDRLKELRKREIRAVQILLSIRNAINAVAMSMPVFASMLSFITYSLSDHGLSPARVFSSLALFNSLRMPLNLLPLVLGQVTDAQTALHRIQEFLLSEEQQDQVIWDPDMDPAVEVQQATFTWERNATQDKDTVGAFQTRGELMAARKADKARKKAQKKADKAAKKSTKGKKSPGASAEDVSSEATETEPFKLRDVDFTVGKNELLAVIGTVGSGKSSLLAALAGDMRKTGGKVKMASGRAFCPQYAWIQNATLKDNILFGKPYRAKWYREVIDACALRPDLDILPSGDQTEIGERGITLSGGQKQRLNIARAIYFDADIILMDDPLSAVDAHVGRHIMDKAICGLMKEKCRILATHQLHVLSRCDRIIWMEDGQILDIDTFDNLMSHSTDFQKLMATTAQEDVVLANPDAAESPEKKAKDKPKKGKAAGLMQQEERAVKSVSWTVWGAYIRASGSWAFWPLIFIALIMSQGANIVTSLWLSWWVSDKFGFSEGTYIATYAVLGLSQALFMFTFATILSTSGTNASRVMLQRAMTRVLRAPMSFFDTTPLGRITNRFSKDVDSMDNSLTDAMRMYFLTLAMITSVFALIIAYFHFFAVALGPLFVVFLFAASYYRSSAREIKRHEAVLRSTVFARFSESISGVASIRAYGLQTYFVSQVRDAIDNMNSAYFLTFANQRWLSTRLDAIGNLLVFVTGILVVTDRFDVNPSIAGLVLSYILAIVQMIQFTVRQLAEVENNMNATERLHYYGSELDQEPPLKGRDVPEAWPHTGAITFRQVEMRYRPELPLVLHGLDFQVRGGERIGIVGRTGAGKSSIMSALFRLTELSAGQIQIDDIDIATVGLYDLRSRLAIIPQDPTLFRGTIRSNLDPFKEHTDLELWAALRKADLVGAESAVPDKEKETDHDSDHDSRPASAATGVAANGTAASRIHLDSSVEEEGLNFSLGQRQLMALARALVRNSQIIVCDEATSSVDFETDEKIQRTMRTAFAGKTLLCIAHRLKTIINYDRICVMDQGRIAELDTPVNLFDAHGIFRSMCDKSHIVREDFFRESRHDYPSTTLDA